MIDKETVRGNVVWGGGSKLKFEVCENGIYEVDKKFSDEHKYYPIEEPEPTTPTPFHYAGFTFENKPYKP